MKILLVGEYSRLHNSLKEGLVTLGHEVCIVSAGDGFKDYPSDIKLKRKYHSGVSKKIKVGLYRIFGIDISSISIKKQFLKHKNHLQGFDVVQLINESPLGIAPKHEKQIIQFLNKNNSKLFLLSCGADYMSIKYAFDKKLRYSILDPYLTKRKTEIQKSHRLKYLSSSYKSLHQFIYGIIQGVIVSDMDYHLPLKNNPKYLGLIPNPINTECLTYPSISISNKIIIFLGINRSNYLSKGINYFEKALDIIQKKHPEKVEIKIVENLPYSEYISTYNKAHILLDQVLSYDQGYNALEAMAKGKVVFTGAEKEFEAFYKLDKTVAINALPNVDYLVEQLEKLILQPELISEIGNNAKAFIEEHHYYKKIAKKYLETWETN